MLSKVRGKNYLILHPGDKYYTKVNKNKMDRSLGRIIRALEVIDQEMRDNSDVRDLIWDEVFYNTQFDSGYGEYPNGIGMVLEYAEGLKQHLETGDDEIINGGRSSTNVVYKMLPIGKKLMKIIQNTKK